MAPSSTTTRSCVITLTVCVFGLAVLLGSAYFVHARQSQSGSGSESPSARGRAEGFDAAPLQHPSSQSTDTRQKSFSCKNTDIACANVRACEDDQQDYDVDTVARIAPLDDHPRPSPGLEVGGALRIGPAADAVIDADGETLSVRDMHAKIRDAEANVGQIESALRNKHRTVRQMRQRWEEAAPLYVG